MRTSRDSLFDTLRQLTGGCLHPGGLSLTSRALEAASFAPGARLLDLGCGDGASLGLLASLGFAAVGLDRSPARARTALAGACGAPGTAVVLADMAAPPFAEAVFDGILCECVLSLAADKAKVLAGCARLLRPGGRIILSDLTLAQRKAPPETAAAAKSGTAAPLCAQGAVSVGQWRALFEAAGLSLVLLEDQSRALRELAAKLVWQGHSLAALSGLWHNAGMEAKAALCEAPPGPGYLLLVAEKRQASCCQR